MMQTLKLQKPESWQLWMNTNMLWKKQKKWELLYAQEVDTLHKLTAEYNKTLRDHLDNETRVKRLLVHIRNNIMYYMQAIWSMEPPDQRFLRMYKIQVPDLKLDDTRPDGGRIYRVEVENTIEDDPFAIFRPEGYIKT